MSLKGRRGILLLALAMALVFLGALVLPLGLLAQHNAERQRTALASLQALYLAEAAAREAIRRIQLNPMSPAFGPQPVAVCRSSPVCTPSSPDYVGRYCYSSGLSGCTASFAPPRWTVEAVGEHQGLSRRVRAVYHILNGVEAWWVDP